MVVRLKVVMKVDDGVVKATHKSDVAGRGFEV